MPAPPPSAARSVAPPSSRRAPPPLPSTPNVAAAPPEFTKMGTMSLAKRLVLTYQGQTYDVDKEHFIIGRSKGQADRLVDEANVSRQHAANERIGSINYLDELGSTNGVFVGGDRVTRRALVDGDTIIITTHRIACRLG
jgi:pSer/pThr/pTyr-binding forkhead associated (FHA) protein